VTNRPCRVLSGGGKTITLVVLLGRREEVGEEI
jgi:hypothetical protein